jgi:hypothetical protein
VWIPNAFNGFSLLVAVGLAKFQGGVAFLAIRRVLRMKSPVRAEEDGSVAERRATG